MGKVIAILATLDTKSEETGFLCGEIESKEYATVILDLGTKGRPGITPDITRQEIILAAGKTTGQMYLLDRGQRMEVMVKGAIQKIKEIYYSGDLIGVVSIGGATGTQMGTSIMKCLSFGIPKLAVSSTAALRGFAHRFIGTSDITLHHTVIELSGLNTLIRNVLSQAAGAICGMTEAHCKNAALFQGVGKSALIAMTHFNPCEKCAATIRVNLEKRGYQVVGFSAAGVGDRAMEKIIERENIFKAVIDLAPGGVGEELFQSDRAAGTTRLEAAGKIGIPQVISTCGVNLMSPRKSRYKPDYYQRKKYEVDSLRTFIRLSKEEIETVARVFAEKLNKANGRVKIVVPLGGWSSVDPKGTYMYEPDTDKLFVNELRRQLKEDIEIREVEADLDTTKFALAVVETFDEIVQRND
jgi:uncharacterized protein (UPF0261 family)